MPARKARELTRPETLDAFADVCASLFSQVADKIATGDCLLTVAQLAERWATSRTKVRALIYAHRLPCVQLNGPGSPVRVRVSAADAYVRSLEGQWQRPLRKAS